MARPSSPSLATRPGCATAESRSKPPQRTFRRRSGSHLSAAWEGDQRAHGVEYVCLVLSAFIFGLVASSALLIGAVAGAYWTPPRLQTLRYRGLECYSDHTRRRGGARQRGPL